MPSEATKKASSFSTLREATFTTRHFAVDKYYLRKKQPFPLITFVESMKLLGKKVGNFSSPEVPQGRFMFHRSFFFYFLLPNQASSFGQSTPLPKAGKVSLCCHTLSRPLTFWLCSSRQVRGARSVGEASTDMRHFDMTRGDRVIFYIFSEQPEIKAIET